MKVNDTLKMLRRSRNLTQNEVAEILNVSLSSYQKYERDKNSVIPSLDVLIRIADFYGVSIDYLLGRNQGEPSTIEKLAGEFNMSALEREIIDGYVKLPKDMREDLMEFLHKSVKKVMSESKAEEKPPHVEQSEKETITTLRYARSEDGHPPEVYETTKDFSKFPPTKSKL